jgi:hypothetical protein
VKRLTRLHHFVGRLSLDPGRRFTASWLLRFMVASLLSLLLWAGFLWTVSLVAAWATARQG